MRSFYFCYFLVVIAVATGPVFADPPKKPRSSQYTRLWTSSPFTIKPEAAVAAKESPLERDWMIGSIRGYSVTLINKKDRKNRLRFLSGYPVEGYELLDVEQDTKKSKNSRVRIKKGSQTAWISYDENLIKVRSSGVVKKPAPQRTAKTNTSSQKRRVVPPVPSNSQSTQGRKNVPRPRVRSVPRK